MPEVKYRGPGPEKRIADRLKPSNEHSTASHHVVQGSGARRTVTTVHHGGSQAAPGEMGDGEMGDA